MAKRKVATAAEEAVIEAQEITTSSQPFWVENQKLIMYVLGGIAALFLGWWLYREMIVGPKQNDAITSMWQAEQAFEKDSFRVALDGGGYDGFLTIADKYSGTKAADMANFYAGVCHLQLGEFDNAIDVLGKCSANSDIQGAVINGVLGDCYSEKKEMEKALEYYEKAADASQNDVLATYYLKKTGMLAELLGKNDVAKKAFERILKEHPNQQSADWRDIEKYIYRVGGGK